MPIDVACPSCKTQFRVSDKFAGQKGPCPKCKQEIQVPEKAEDVVIHAPEEVSAGEQRAKRASRPIVRKETKVTPVSIVAVVGAIVTVLVIAVILRSSIAGAEQLAGWAKWVLGAGAWLLGPPLALAGYTFLRDAELDPFRGRELAIRSIICGTVYAILWGVYAGLKVYALSEVTLQPFYYLFLVPPFVLVGALAAFASYDLDYGIGVIHYGLYVLVTLALCWIVGAPLS
jgi:predicted Zn finger-like uncharacterized protein